MRIILFFFCLPCLLACATHSYNTHKGICLDVEYRTKVKPELSCTKDTNDVNCTYGLAIQIYPKCVKWSNW